MYHRQRTFNDYDELQEYTTICNTSVQNDGPAIDDIDNMTKSNYFTFFDFVNDSTNDINRCKENKSTVFEYDFKHDTLSEKLKELTWLTTLTIKNTMIPNLTWCPENLKILVINNNFMESLNGLVLPIGLEDFNYTSNRTKVITNLRGNIKHLNVSNNLLLELDCSNLNLLESIDASSNTMMNNLKLCDGVKSILISRTSFSTIDWIPDSVQVLETNSCVYLHKIDKLPNNLINWKSFCAKINEINCIFPDSVQYLDFYSNCMTKFQKFPKNLKFIDLAGNPLSEIPEFNENIEKIDLKGTGLDIKKLKELSDELEKKNCFLNHDGNSKQDDLLDDWLGSNNNSNGSDIISMWNMFRRQSPVNLYNNDAYSESNPNYIILNKVLTI